MLVLLSYEITCMYIFLEMKCYIFYVANLFMFYPHIIKFLGPSLIISIFVVLIYYQFAGGSIQAFADKFNGALNFIQVQTKSDCM